MARMSNERPRWTSRVAQRLRERWLSWLSLFGFWTLLGLLSSLQVAYLYQRYDKQIPLEDIFFWQMVDWYFWLPATPFIWWLGRRLPLARQSWLVNGSIHLAISIAFSVVHLANSSFIGRLIDAPKYNKWSFNELLELLLARYIHLDILTYWCILAAGVALRYYSQLRQSQLREAELESKLARARLQALEMQLQPHFLFNTLHAIGVLIRKQDTRVALRMLTGLSDLLRATLDKAGQQLVSVREELDFTRMYLDIEQIRFQDRLTIRTDIDQEVLSARVPSLILQPLAENAIRHGIAPRAAGGTVALIARVHDNRLQLEVCDDGVGLPADGIRSGVGLDNVRARLEQLYPDDHSFAVSAGESGGVRACIEVPLDLVGGDDEPT